MVTQGTAGPAGRLLGHLLRDPEPWCQRVWGCPRGVFPGQGPFYGAHTPLPASLSHLDGTLVLCQLSHPGPSWLPLYQATLPGSRPGPSGLLEKAQHPWAGDTGLGLRRWQRWAALPLRGTPCHSGR